MKKKLIGHLRNHIHHDAGIAGVAGGVAAAPTIVTAVGGSAAASGLTGGIATLGGGTMLCGISAISAIPIALGLAGLGVFYVVKRVVWG